MMTLIDCLGINAMRIDKKLLALVGNTEVIRFSDIYNEADLSHKIAMGKNIGLDEIYRCVDQLGLSYLIQEQHDHFIYNLLMASVISKYPDAFLKNPLPTILRSSVADDQNSLTIPFYSSEQKSDVMAKTEKFIADNERLSSIRNNIMLITNELMMNALYCAPVDTKGTPLYLDKDRSTPVNYPDALQAEVNLSFNDTMLVVGCRDPYGSVDKKIVTNRLHEVFQFNQKASVIGKGEYTGGSGLGLKIVIESSTGFGMVVKKGLETFAYAALPLGKGHKSIIRMAKNLCLNFYK